MYYTVVKLNRLRILEIQDKDHLMSEIRYDIIPYLFKTQNLLNELFVELNRETTIDEIRIDK